MNTIKVQVNNEGFVDFELAGYYIPAELHNSPDLFLVSDEDWYYLNMAGFAQKYDPARPPSRFPSPERAILIRKKTS